MVALGRKQSKIFASNAPLSQITVFRTTESDSPQTSNDPNTIQNDKYLSGWLNADNSGNEIPYAEDMNAVLYTLSYNTSYLYEKGIPEYSSTQIYYVNSFCQYQGKIYRCKLDDTLNYVPTTTERWDEIPTSSYSATNIGTGDGSIYAGISNNQFQFKRLVAGSNVLITETSDSVTIASTGGGGGASFVANAPLVYNNGVLSIPAATSSQNGYLTAADWASFNSKLSSTIFSSANIWTGDNTFDKILPRTTTSQIGDVNNSFLYGYFYSLQDLRTVFVGSNNQRTGLWYNNGTANVGFAYLGNDAVSSGAIGIHPFNDAATTTSPVQYLGSSSAWWGYGYIKKLNTIDIATSTIAATTATCATINATSVLPNSNQSTTAIGSSSNPWTEAFIGDLSVADIAISGDITPTTPTSSTLGTSTHKWNIHCNYFYSYNTLRFNSASIYCGMASSAAAQLYNTIYSYSSSSSSSSTGWATIGYKDGGYNFSPAVGDSTATIGTSNYPWRAVYTTSGASGGIFFGSNSYVKDITGNTLKLNASSTIQLYSAETQCYVFSSSFFYPAGTSGTLSLGTSSKYWKQIYTNKILVHTNATIEPYQSNDGIQIFWKTSGTSGNLVSAIGYHTYFMPSDTNTINLGSGDNRWKTIFTNNSVNVSDRRSKEGIEDLDGGLEKLKTIGVKSFKLKNHDEGIIYGFVAQDELERNPELVVVPENYSQEEDGGELMYMPNNVLFLAVKAIQELSAKVEDLENQLKELEK